MKFLKPLSAEGNSAPDMVFRRLREAITMGELSPGEQLPPENELARMLGVAPMTARIALGAMRDMGLLTTVRGRNGGNFIAEDVGERLADAARRLRLTREELRDLTDWRRAISGEACYLAAERGTEEDFVRIEQAAREYDDLLPKFPDMRFADARFHMVIAEVSGSSRLLKQETEIQVEVTNFILSAAKPAAAKNLTPYNHDRIVKAIRNRQPEAARDAMAEHAEQTFAWVTVVI